MSLWDRDKEFQLELLRIQLKHEREVVFSSVGMGVGASFLIFALTLALTVSLSEKAIDPLWLLMIEIYLIAGPISLRKFFFRKDQLNHRSASCPAVSK